MAERTQCRYDPRGHGSVRGAGLRKRRWIPGSSALRPFADIAIRQKLTLLSLLAVVVALLLTVSALAVYEFRSAHTRSRSHLTTLAEIVGDTNHATFEFRDARDAARTLAVLGREEAVVLACFYEADGAYLAGYSRGERSCPRRAGDGRVEPRRFGLDEIRHLRWILDDRGQRLGAVELYSDLREVHARLRAFLGIVGAVLCLSVAVAWALAFRLQRFISRPIKRLVEVARRISSEKNYALRVEGAGDDELGRLIQSFNDMLDQIQARDRQLERHRDTLDEEVQTRTLELEKAVVDLQDEIEQREKAEERIRFLAYYDVLTGLPNRQLLRERLDRAIADGRHDGGKPLALLFLDLDRFKEVNDSYGHATGDELLEQVADRIVGCVRGSDQVTRPDGGTTVSRQGGDEFTVLLTGLQGHHDASRVARRILEALQEPFALPEGDVVIGASIGIAIHPDDGEDSDTLIKHADTAMYHAKGAGRNDFEYFSESMKLEAVRKLTLEAELRRALEEEQFELVYQPIVSLETEMIVGVEALLRWDHPERGRLRPGDFIAVAEETGLIVPIGEWVLDRACHQAAEWERQGLRPIRIAVNVSTRQFRKGSLLDAAEAALAASGLSPERLEIEVTESTMLQNEEEAIRVLRELRSRGVRVALDDFGTGYSSLSHLRRLPLDSLKIDQSFVQALADAPERDSIVSAIIAMGHGLGLTTVGEGVEDEGQLFVLRVKSCDEVQGNLLAGPLAPQAIPEALDRPLRPERQGAGD